MVMNLDFAWLIAVFLVSLRLGALFVMSPILSSLSGMIAIRVLFTVALSLALVLGFGVRLNTIPTALGSLIVAALVELIVGATLAFGVSAAFGAFSVAGKVLDIQSGFGIGNVFDPVTRAGSPLFATMLNLLAVVVFFGMDGHHALLRGVAFSFQQVPPGTGFTAFPIEAVIRQFGAMFSLGVALIAPVMFCLFLVEAGLSMVSRVLPQMNVFMVGIPVKLFAGIAMFALTVGYLGPVMGRVYASIFNYWEQVLG
ncbi:MAG: flagellar biosynthetic protein FliR [Burkholderiales bacterium]|nr:flagellar biosynthetic protein FliR [Burkholderiales bacterium]